MTNALNNLSATRNYEQLCRMMSISHRLFMSWKGVEGDQGIYSSSTDDQTWSPQSNVPGVGTSTETSLALFEDHL